MAFSGLPSKSCANCRLRRIKCNLAEPECAQCRRAEKACPGYRDQLDLLFRDENAKVIRKARGPAAVTLLQKSKVSDMERVPTPLNTPKTTCLSDMSNISCPSMCIIRNPATSVDDLGLDFFFYQYMTAAPLAPHRPTSRANIFSSQIFRGLSDPKLILDAISCVGLAGLSNVNNDWQMMQTARLKYATTLQRVMRSIQTPESADLGYILKAVMLLALFDMVNRDSPGEGMWGVHLEGIAALLNSIGFRRAQAKPGVHIKHQFFFAMFIKYVQSGQKLPATIVKWSRIWGAFHDEADTPIARLTEIMLQFVNFHASVAQGHFTDPSTAVQGALLLEKALEDWRAGLPPTWLYKVVASPCSKGTYDGQYHVYSTLFIARMWDHYRWTRILVHEMILEHVILLPSLPTELCKQQAQSLEIISHLASCTCVSVASQLYRPECPSPTTFDVSQLTAAFTLLWPLKVAGSATGVSNALHEWIIGVLDSIGQTLGIRQTRAVVFESIVQRENWKIKGVFGSGDTIYTLQKNGAIEMGNAIRTTI